MDYEMEAEFDAHLRTTKGDILINTLRNIKFKDKDPLDQFYTIVNAVFNKLIELDISYVSEVDRQSIIDAIVKIDKPWYKNATAYILGYYASNFSRMDTVFDSLPTVTSLMYIYPIFKISKMDVIRYARFWKVLNKTDI